MLMKSTRYVPKNGFKNPRRRLAIKSQENIIRGFVKHVQTSEYHFLKQF